MNNEKSIRFWLCLFAPVLVQLSACATGSLDIKVDAYQLVQLDRANTVPTTAELNRNKVRIAILPSELNLERNQALDREEETLELDLRTELEAVLLKFPRAEVLDRNMSLSLRAALAQYETNNSKPPDLIKQADLLIIPVIGNALIESEYHAPTSNERERKLPGICISTAKISGVLKVFDTETSNVTSIKEIFGQEKYVDVSDRCRPLPDNETHSLYQKSVRLAIDGAIEFIQTFLAPRGYIAEKRTDGESWVFKVNTAGIAFSKYKKVSIYAEQTDINQLTGQPETGRVVIGKAAITNQIGENFVWIYIDDKVVADRIRLGNLVIPDVSDLNTNPLNMLIERIGGGETTNPGPRFN